MTHQLPHAGHATRFVHLLLVVVLAAALIGFFIGIDYGVPKTDETAGFLNVGTQSVDDAAAVVPTLNYIELQTTDIGPNRNWKSSLSTLPSATELSTSTSPPLSTIKQASLHIRSQRRAFNGAPPVIPHVVEQMSTDSCLSCHGKALRIANQTANLLPHPELTNCMQCHAPVEASPFEEFVLAHNDFAGLPAPFEGQRAWDGAPPMIPHSTHMRDNCLACHGPAGLVGLRTTHPERQSCLQCHAPSAELDQNITASTSPFLQMPDIRGGS